MGKVVGSVLAVLGIVVGIAIGLKNNTKIGGSKRKRRKSEEAGFPYWAAGPIAVGVVTVIALIVIVAGKKQPAEQMVAATPDNTPAPNVKPPSGTTPPGDTTPPVPALAAGLVERPPLGGFIGRQPYREFRQDGSYIIGFDVGLGKIGNTEVINYLRPIWKTPTGEQKGTVYGRTVNPITTVKAKDGYAVGGVVIAGGGLLEGLCFTFMPVNGKVLNPSDSYTSDWYGEQRRKPRDEAGKRAGDGSLVVGFGGKRLEDKGGSGPDDGGAICTFGLIVVQASTPPVTPEPPRQVRCIYVGGGEGKDFALTSPNSGWLVGFEVYLTKREQLEVVAGVRPVFQIGDTTADGELRGTQTEKVVRLVAKPGYSVGALTGTARVVTGVHGFSLTFMKVAGGKLDATDTYESDWVGQADGTKRKITTDGVLPIGMCGRINKESNLGALGVAVPLPKGK